MRTFVVLLTVACAQSAVDMDEQLDHQLQNFAQRYMYATQDQLADGLDREMSDLGMGVHKGLREPPMRDSTIQALDVGDADVDGDLEALDMGENDEDAAVQEDPDDQWRVDRPVDETMPVNVHRRRQTAPSADDESIEDDEIEELDLSSPTEEEDMQDEDVSQDDVSEDESEHPRSVRRKLQHRMERNSHRRRGTHAHYVHRLRGHHHQTAASEGEDPQDEVDDVNYLDLGTPPVGHVARRIRVTDDEEEDWHPPKHTHHRKQVRHVHHRKPSHRHLEDDDELEALDVSDSEPEVAIPVKHRKTRLAKAPHKHKFRRQPEMEDKAEPQGFKMPRVQQVQSRLDKPPVDIWGTTTARNCNQVRFDYTEGANGCIMCQQVADSYFRNETVCHCYKSTRGDEYHAKCKQMASTFMANQEEISTAVEENHWTDLFKSFGICDKYGYCPGG